MGEKTDKAEEIDINYGSESVANQLSVQNIKHQSSNGLIHDSAWDRSIVDMGKTYKYIRKSPNINPMVKGVLFAGTTAVNGISLSATAPFAAVGGITKGLSEGTKRLRKRCFRNLGFSSFDKGLATVVMAPIGGVAWLIEKTTKWISRGFMAITNGIIRLANRINRRIVRRHDSASKTDKIVKKTEAKHKFKVKVYSATRNSEKPEEIKHNLENKELTLKEIVKEQKEQKEKLRYLGKIMDSKRKEMRKLASSMESIDNEELKNQKSKTRKHYESMLEKYEALENELKPLVEEFSVREKGFKAAQEEIKNFNSRVDKGRRKFGNSKGKLVPSKEFKKKIENQRNNNTNEISNTKSRI